MHDAVRTVGSRSRCKLPPSRRRVPTRASFLYHEAMRFSLCLCASLAIVFLTMFLSAQEASVGSGKSENQAAAQLGTLDTSAYQNRFFGFRYKIPYGWVDRTDSMREASADPSKSLLLLAAFERPPEATAESVNSAVVITGESRSVYPGLKTAAEYFAPLTEVTTAKGFEPVNPPYYFEIGTKRLVRGDFSRKTGKVAMYQSSIAMLDRGYFVSFTFLGGSEDEVNGLIERLSFTTGTMKTTPSRK